MLTRTEWFAKLKWDQQNRIQNFLAVTAGASPEHSVMFARWLVCAAWRTLEPGARAFSIAFRGVNEDTTVAALKALAAPWLGTAFIPERLPCNSSGQITFKNQVADKIVIHTSKIHRRDSATFSILAARIQDHFSEKAGDCAERTFVVACTLTDDEALPEGFYEIRVTGFDVEAIQRERNNLFAEARECAVAAMLKSTPNEAVRKKRIAWEKPYGD